MAELPTLLQRQSIGNVLIVTDEGISQLGLMDPWIVHIKKRIPFTQSLEC
ncbi:hypothetical protein M3197_07065 [Sporosarcina aquimarina]|nr:hypothetical protein [Sporosarcina aquimarina]MCM3757250.1 hypothetical protein [Sporosarcina aquimarina]